MMRNYHVAYSNKNFYRDLGLSQHFTFKGWILRTKRRHPTATKIITFSAIYICTSVVSLVLIPGTMLPMQRQLKQYLFDKLCDFNRFKYMSSFNPHPGLFIQHNFRSLIYAVQHQVLSVQHLAGRLREINEILLSEKWGNEISNRTRVEAIINSVLLMEKIISSVKLKDYLRDPNLHAEYVKMVENANRVKTAHSHPEQQEQTQRQDYENEESPDVRGSQKLSQDLKPRLLVTFKIYDYLLKYRGEDVTDILQKLYSFLDSNKRGEQNQRRELDFGFVARSFANDEELKKLVKQVYLSEPRCRKIIQRILKQVDRAVKQKDNP